jgi:DUF1680 family protein
VASLTDVVPEARNALNSFLKRLDEVLTISGAPIGDEWIAERTAHETHTGYEFCSIHELLHSYALLLPYQQPSRYAEAIEHLFYNAALGAHHPTQSSIAYLKTDNSFIMDGTRNGEAEPDRKQTRYKYSPVHQDVAVCCSPNAGRITPYFVEQAWYRDNQQRLVNQVLMPSVLTTVVDGIPVRIDTETEYPFGLTYTWLIQSEKPVSMTLKIRKPSWATGLRCSQPFQEADGYLLVTTSAKKIQRIRWTWETQIKQQAAKNGETCFSYGPLLYAYPIPFREEVVKVYEPGFVDWNLYPRSPETFSLLRQEKPVWKGQSIQLRAKSNSTNQIKNITLSPLARTALRQLSFVVSSE